MTGEIIKLNSGLYEVTINEESGQVEIVKTLEEAQAISDYVKGVE